MALATLTMICVYSLQLGRSSCSRRSSPTPALRLGLYRMFRRRSEAAIETKALENSMFVETVRAVQSLKLFNREIEREGQWLNRYADTVNANIRLGRARIAFTSLNDIDLRAREHRHHLSGGEARTEQPTHGRHDLRVHELQAAVHRKGGAAGGEGARLPHSRSASRTARRYRAERAGARSRPGRWLMRGRSAAGSSCAICVSATRKPSPSCWRTSTCTVEAGSFVTIMGPSGGGKTTLLKIMLGLLEPTSGEVLIDGVPLAHDRTARISRANRRRDAGGPTAVGIDCRQHLLLRSGIRSRAG